MLKNISRVWPGRLFSHIATTFSVSKQEHQQVLILLGCVYSVTLHRYLKSTFCHVSMLNAGPTSLISLCYGPFQLWQMWLVLSQHFLAALTDEHKFCSDDFCWRHARLSGAFKGLIGPCLTQFLTILSVTNSVTGSRDIIEVNWIISITSDTMFFFTSRDRIIYRQTSDSYIQWVVVGGQLNNIIERLYHMIWTQLLVIVRAIPCLDVCTL